MKLSDSLDRPSARRSLRLLALPVLAVLAACGDPAPDTAPAQASSATAPRAAASAADADLVAAVPTGDARTPVSLKFQVMSRPLPGEPFKIRFMLTAIQAVDSVQVTFEPGAELDLADESPYFNLAHTAAGDRAEHQLTLSARSAGISELKAEVLVDTSLGSSTSQFTVPLIVGDGVAAPVKKRP